MHRVARLAVAASVVLLAGCSSSGSKPSGTPTSTAAISAPTDTFEVVVSGGKPQGGVKTLKAHRGDQVVLHVTSDVSDEVHLHGYDLHGDVTPTTPVTIRFSATITGVFTIELESRSLEIAELQVS